MTPAEFRTALAGLNLTLTDAARTLDLGARTISRYANGHWPVPRVVELALEGLKWRQKWSPPITINLGRPK